MTVTRYRTDPEFVYMIESSSGPFVLHEDCAAVERERDELLQHVCDECRDETGSPTGWVENRVEGRVPCTCMLEAEPYQHLQRERDALRRKIERVAVDRWGMPMERALAERDRATAEAAELRREVERLRRVAVLTYINEHPGVDSEAIADVFGLPIGMASDLCRELFAAGEITWASEGDTP